MQQSVGLCIYMYQCIATGTTPLKGGDSSYMKLIALPPDRSKSYNEMPLLGLYINPYCHQIPLIWGMLIRDQIPTFPTC